MRWWPLMLLSLTSCTSMHGEPDQTQDAFLIVCVLASCEVVLSDRTRAPENISQTEETDLSVGLP